MNLAIERLLKKNPELKKKRRGLPGTGSRPDQLSFFSDLKKIDDAFIYSNSLYALEDSIDKSLKLFNAGAGSPLRTQPFPLSSESLKKIISCEELSQYQLAAGNEEYRFTIAKYLLEQGFMYENSRVGPNNIIFNNSTTESFNLLVDVISRPYDVFLFTGPTYGLFCYIPERHNAITKIIPLSEEDDWKINPKKLEEHILQIQSELAELQVKLKLDYLPKIVAFVNINPSNPTGKVMGLNDLDRLSALKHLSQQYGFFIIDDIIYRELSFPGCISAIPLATIDEDNENIITLMGASKSFGLAGARAGMIIADERIIRGVRNQVFQLMDSTSLYVGNILSSIYNTSVERKNCYQHYFSKLTTDYLKKWLLVKGMVYGEDALTLTQKEIVYSMIGKDLRYSRKSIFSPFNGVKFAGNIEPESGFFALLDFSSLKGLHYKDLIIKTERDVLLFYYLYAYTKLLMGSSIGWPNKNEFVARISFAMNNSEIIEMFMQMKQATNLLDR